MTPEQVQTRRDFLQYIQTLQSDLQNNPDSWENKTLPDFLEALAAYAEDIDGYYTNQKIPINADTASWRVFADIFAGAKLYE
jgi:hypothetical protein